MTIVRRHSQSTIAGPGLRTMGVSASRAAALLPAATRPESPDQRGTDIAKDRRGHGDGQDADRNGARCLVNPEQQAAEFAREALRGFRVHQRRIVMKLPGTDP